MSTHASNAIVSTAKLIALGDAIRAKAGLTAEMTLDEMVAAIGNIKTEDDSEFAWIGKDVEDLGEIYSLDRTLNTLDSFPTTARAATTAQWSTSCRQLVVDLAEYEYAVLWVYDNQYKYSSSLVETQKYPERTLGADLQTFFRRPAETPASISADSNVYNEQILSLSRTWHKFGGSDTVSRFTSSAMLYFATADGIFNSNTNEQCSLTIMTPRGTAGTTTTYISTNNFAALDRDRSTVKLRGRLFRYRPKGRLRSLITVLDDVYANPL